MINKRHNSRGCIQVNLYNVRNNIETIHNIISKDVKVIAVVKADAYGLGMLEVSQKIKEIVDMFAVATIEEALDLRKSGIENNILILGIIPQCCVESAIENNISIAVCSMEQAYHISEIAQKLGKKATIHIKLDTGMGRIGFKIEEKSVSQIKSISNMPYIEIEGIFTHFSKSDEYDKHYTEEQIKKYNKLVSALEREGVNVGIKHCCNSAGIIDFSEAHYDAVRAGIIIYGMCPSAKYDNKDFREKFHQVMEWKSQIVFIKDVPKGTAISYGGTFFSEHESVIATVPIGYADGLPRVLSNNGYMIVKGKRVPIVGRVCMDQCMIDVTHVKDVEIGDTVTIIGSDGDECITIEEVAKWSNTINYEITCGIGKRMKREYIELGY